MTRKKAGFVCLVLGLVLTFEELAHLQTTRSGGPFTITIGWDPPDEGQPTSYIIEAGSRPGRSDITVFETAALADPILVIAGVPAGTYFVRVRARNSAGISEPSNEIVVNLGSSICGVPVAPAGLTTSATDGLATLGWTASPGATSYRLEAGSTPGANDVFSGDIGNLTSLVAQAPAGRVFVRVRAVNACGLSPPSNEAVVG
jgi:hypothetical protein